MADFLSQYTIQRWLEMCPQGYLEDTVYGHAPGESEPEELLANELLREDSIATTVQLVVGERCALAASSGLVNCAPDFPSKRFLATQTLDEARHVEIFTQRLYDLGVAKEDLERQVEEFAHRDAHAAPVERVGARRVEHQRVGSQPSSRAGNGSEVLMVVYPLEHHDPLRGGYHRLQRRRR